MLINDFKEACLPQSICKKDACSRLCFGESDCCALHCEKNSYHHDFRSFLLSKFNDELINYVYEHIKEHDYCIANQKILEFGEDAIRKNLSNLGAVGDWREIRDLFLKIDIYFYGISFPARDARDHFDYLSVLEKFRGIHFQDCTFQSKSLDLPEVRLLYDSCVFLSDWSVSNTKILANVSKAIYSNCSFQNEVSILIQDDAETCTIDHSLFCDCSFEKVLFLENTNFKSTIFNNIDLRDIDSGDIDSGDIDSRDIDSRDTEITKVRIKNITINKCSFDDKFILNNLQTEYLSIRNSEFKSKVELKEGEIKEILISNSNFEKIFDSFKTKYNKFNCYRSIFYDFVAFEQCKFSTSEEGTLSKFKYSTFLSFTNFRKTTFFSGLCLEEANFKEPPNFLNMKLEPTNNGVFHTSRETLRIIKYSFDRLGNQIEANKYFVHELKKYRRELKASKEGKQEKCVLWINQRISNFGQSYLRPMSFYLGTVVIYALLNRGLKNNWAYTSNPTRWNNAFSKFSDSLNEIALSFMPFKSFLHPGMEFISLIIYIIFAVLTWQIIVAVKRITKR